MHILYSGPLRPGSLTEARHRALRDLDYSVTALDQVPFIDRGSSLTRRAQLHSLVGPGISAYNRALLDAVRHSAPDVVYIDQAAYLSSSTLRRIKETGAVIVHFTSEYLGFRSYWYRKLFKAVGLFDVHVITNELNRPILEAKGARRVETTEFGYDPAVHKPPETPGGATFDADVVFVGHWEPAYEETIAALQGAGIDVKLWGPGWQRSKLPGRDEVRPATGETYAQVISTAKISLGLLSAWNKNTSTSRTFEIPAIGGFLLAQRTDQQLRYFTDGVEAEFFSSIGELIEKVRRYLADETGRAEIARRGHKRCLSSGYTHKDRMEELMRKLS